MCGICGAISCSNEIKNVALKLEMLEYRGYDSAGIAYLHKGKIKIVKAVGLIKNLKDKIGEQSGSVVIGHTRWATHGKANVTNAHPHISNDKSVALVHNGIIENYKALKEELIGKGYTFYSETDSEAIAILIEDLKKTHSLRESIISACEKLKGSYALAIIFSGENKIYIAKNQSPLYVAENENKKEVSSDVVTFSNEFDSFYALGDNEFAEVSESGILFFDKNNQKIEKKSQKIDKNSVFFEKNNSSCVMRKEIDETLCALKLASLKFEKLEMNKEINISSYDHIAFIGCGTAYHAGMFGSYMVERFLHKTSSAHIASEFRYSDKVLSKRTLYVLVSQSGETADTIACAKMLDGFATLAITNVEYSMLAKICKFILPIYAGREVAVASTKAYTSQCVAMLYFIFSFLERKDEFLDNLNTFLREYSLQNLDIDTKEVLKFDKIFFIGRGIDYVTCKEASLKLKEISYINCVSLPAGELKHGTLALVDEKSLVFSVITDEKLLNKTLSNLEEVKARGGKVYVLSQFEKEKFANFYGYFNLTKVNSYFMPIVSMIPLQYFALDMALSLGYNPDRPRNLAKSVTVE